MTHAESSDLKTRTGLELKILRNWVLVRDKLLKNKQSEKLKSQFFAAKNAAESFYNAKDFWLHIKQEKTKC